MRWLIIFLSATGVADGWEQLAKWWGISEAITSVIWLLIFFVAGAYFATCWRIEVIR